MKRPPTSDFGDIPLDALAARISSELATLATLSSEVQRALSLCHFAEHTDPGAIRGLQGIDRITQTLEDLGRLMSAVSAELPAELCLRAVPLFSNLKLQELISNLNTLGHPENNTHNDSGTVHWL